MTAAVHAQQKYTDRLLRILRLKAVQETTGYSKSEIYRRIANGTFPEPHQLGPNSVGWFEHEIQDWIRENVKVRGRFEARGRKRSGKS